MVRWLTGLLLLCAAAPAAAQAECGNSAEPCAVEEGIYYATLPERPAGAPFVVFLYGFGGAGERTLQNQGFVSNFAARGYALIIPEALRFRPNEPRAWNFRVGDYTGNRNDVAFIGRVIDDAADRFGLDRDRVLVTGFSIGGSMVWDLACLAPDSAAAYAPVSGGFWNPLPDSCAGPVHLFHTHGFSDPVVPLEGRPIDDGEFHAEQGDIYAGLAVWRRTMGCGTRADDYQIEDERWRKIWSGCDAGSLTFMLHPGGHSIPSGWSAAALDWFESLSPATE